MDNIEAHWAWMLLLHAGHISLLSINWHVVQVCWFSLKDGERGGLLFDNCCWRDREAMSENLKLSIDTVAKRIVISERMITSSLRRERFFPLIILSIRCGIAPVLPVMART